MEATCSFCHSHFYGRTDKKFCDDHCRSAYHNMINSLSTNTMRSIHKKLRHNWSILHEHANDGCEIITNDDLEVRGFNKNQITGILREKSKTVYYCYEYKYEVLKDEGIKLINKRASDQVLRPYGL